MAVLCVFNIPATGHVNPSLPLIRALAARGDRVIYFDAESFRGPVEATGAEFRATPFEYDFEPGLSPLAPFQAMSRILGESARLIPALLEETRALRPNAILYDSMCPWGKQIAQLLGKRPICSCAIMYSGKQNLAAWPRNTDLGRSMLRNPLAVALGIARYQRVAFRLKRRYHADSPSFLDFFANPGAMTLVYTSRYFQLGGNLFGPAFKFVGPLLEDRDDAPPLPQDWLDTVPLVYVSLGTIFNDRPDFFQACIKAFEGAPYRVVMAIGRRTNPSDLGALPVNIRVFDYVRQLEILPRAALFITHGGMNSVSEAAWFGTPMLLAPQVGDQVFISYQTEKLGAGKQIDSRRIDPGKLRALAEEIIQTPRYREASEKIGASFRAAGGVPRAIQEIDNFIQAHG